jgi:hypothetical protein
MGEVYQRIARIVYARDNTIRINDTEWLNKYNESLVEIMKEAPLSQEANNKAHVEGIEKDCLSISVVYHHITPSGKVKGPNTYILKIKPHLSLGFTVTVKGKDKDDANEIKESFESWLNRKDEEW